ncbi:hypothetical protein D039_0977A, partial [Vibrio parahaemolyticus EKP-028]
MLGYLSASNEKSQYRCLYRLFVLGVVLASFAIAHLVASLALAGNV